MLVALHRGRGFIAKAIQWQTRSVYSHASVIFEESGVVIEAREFKGVRSILWDAVVASGETVDVFRVKGLVPEAEEAVWEFLQEQLGKPYDYTMVARFITREQAAREESGKWFCSELVFAAFAQAGVKLLERIEPWAVSPGMLRLSTRLEEGKWPQTSTEGAKGGRSGGDIQQRTGKSLATDETRVLLTPALSPDGGEGDGNAQVSTLPGLVLESTQVGKGSSVVPKATRFSSYREGEQAGTPAVRQARGLRYEGDWTGDGACPTTERQVPPPHVGGYEGKEARTTTRTIIEGGGL